MSKSDDVTKRVDTAEHPLRGKILVYAIAKREGGSEIQIDEGKPRAVPVAGGEVPYLCEVDAKHLKIIRSGAAGAAWEAIAQVGKMLEERFFSGGRR